MESVGRLMKYMDLEFYRGKRVFVTGHTGFKGVWLCQILLQAGAKVTGYSLPMTTEPNLFALANLQSRMDSILGDIRDKKALNLAFEQCNPEIVFHLAAQPIVRDSYKDPVYTYETNVMGTVNILECVRHAKQVLSFLNVTTDKVYYNNEWCWGYRENDPLDGYDPYSNSKSCSELVTHSYSSSFFAGDNVPAISTARAGNVIGGGDFANDRIIPDCVRSVISGIPLIIRNPHSVRPYQHVLEPLFAYLMIAQRQCEDKTLAGWYNIGPDECDCVSTGRLVELFSQKWGNNFAWDNRSEPNAVHEANFLKLDCSKVKNVFGWSPRWHIDEAVEKTVDWVKVWLAHGNIVAEMNYQIRDYINGVK